MQARVVGPQQGVPTFFDNFFDQLLHRLAANEAVHGWDPERPAPRGSVQEQHAAELRWLDGFLANQRRGRFVPYGVRRGDNRASAVDVGWRALMMSQGTTEAMSWRGSPLFKTAFDFALLPMMLWDVRPATVFEIGSGTGASARWMADTMRSLGLGGEVYSVDIKPVIEPYPCVHFLAGDCRTPTTLFDPDLLRHAPHPWLVVEDVHINVHDVLVHLDGFLAAGDYLIVEDSATKRPDLDRFLAARAEEYRVDARYTDFFGRNATCAENSIFRKL